jgi:hypothetical protein
MWREDERSPAIIERARSSHRPIRCVDMRARPIDDFAVWELCYTSFG